jgi:hypothetical protein
MLLFSLLGACGGRQSNLGNDTGVRVVLQFSSLRLGPSELIVRLVDGDGQPAAGAAVTVRGDMSHAGMVPVVESGETDGDGSYTTAYEWTMSGDWLVTVTFTLPDGRSGAETFPFTISGS